MITSGIGIKEFDEASKTFEDYVDRLGSVYFKVHEIPADKLGYNFRYSTFAKPIPVNEKCSLFIHFLGNLIPLRNSLQNLRENSKSI